MVAGSTVVISMLGLFAMGLSFMRGAAVVTILAVLVVMLAAVTLFPALLGYLGRHLDRLRLPSAVGPSRSPWAAARAAPRLASAGAGWSSAAASWPRSVASASCSRWPCRYSASGSASPTPATTARAPRPVQAYDMIETGFGAGANGPLVLAAEVPPGGAAVLDPLVAAVTALPGVAAVMPPQLNAAGDTAVVTVVPTTGPQDAATADLIRDLRDDVIPAAAEGVTVHVGGVTATSIDSTANIAGRLPLLIGGVVAAVHAAAAGGVPQSVAIAVKAAAAEPVVGGRRLRRGGLRAAGRLGRAAAGHRQPDAAAGVHARPDVRHAVRAVDGLRGLPGQPYARDLAAHRSTTAPAVTDGLAAPPG